MSGSRKKEALGSALIELMTERPFESITVQDVLDRAGVARSTFYVHYNGKNDLFAADIDRFWASVAESSAKLRDRVLPVRELLEHAAGTRDFQRALRASGKYSEVFEAGKVHIARAIEQRLRRAPRTKHVKSEHLHAIAVMHAAAFLALMEWWVEQETPLPAAEADELFHRTLWRSI